MGYAKGYRGERELLHKLANAGFMAIRAPRSGRIGLPSPDIVAIKDGRIIVIECKSRERGFKISKQQLEELAAWERNGARAYIGWKISHKGWKFLKLEDVIANNGNVGRGFIEKMGLEIGAL